MGKNQKMKRIFAVILALVLALLSSVAVYATVTYDSSQDPVVSLSGMKAYVEGIVNNINNTIADVTSRVGALEIAYAAGGGTGGGTGGGVSLEAYQSLVNRINALEEAQKSLTEGNTQLKKDLAAAKTELNSLITDLQTQYDSILTELGTINGRISDIQNQVDSAKGDVSTLKKDFKQISDISTELNTLKYKINALTSTNGDITVLKQKCDSLEATLNGIIEKVGTLYEVVLVPYGATVYAVDADDTVLAVMRSGSAVAVSPFNTPGTMQGLNDLSDGSELYDGDQLMLFHNILIPRGGDDGRGIRVTSIDGAYIMIGGDYKIVNP